MDDDEKRCIFKVVTANKRSYAYFTLNFNKNWDKIRMKIRITFLTDFWLFGHVFIFQNQVNIHKNSEFLELLQLNKNQEFFRDKILNPNHIYPIFRPFMAIFCQVNQVKNSQNSEFLESDLAKGWDDREWKLRNSQEIMKAIKWGEIQEVIKINFCKVVRCPPFQIFGQYTLPTKNCSLRKKRTHHACFLNLKFNKGKLLTLKYPSKTSSATCSYTNSVPHQCDNLRTLLKW